MSISGLGTAVNRRNTALALRSRRFHRAVQRVLEIGRLLDAYPCAAAGARGGAFKV